MLEAAAGPLEIARQFGAGGPDCAFNSYYFDSRRAAWWPPIRGATSAARGAAEKGGEEDAAAHLFNFTTLARNGENSENSDLPLSYLINLTPCFRLQSVRARESCVKERAEPLFSLFSLFNRPF